MLHPEDRDVADERKRVLDCQPVIESMVGSPLVLQELTKVRPGLGASGLVLGGARDQWTGTGGG